MSGWLPSIFCILLPGLPAASSFAVGVGQFCNARCISVRFIPDDRRPVHGRGVGKGARKFLGERPAERSAISFVLLASGVGSNDPDPSKAGIPSFQAIVSLFAVM